MPISTCCARCVITASLCLTHLEITRLLTLPYRPSSTQHHRAALGIDEDNEDAPAVVDGVEGDEDDDAALQHGSLRAAFPMAFGAPLPSTLVTALPSEEPLQ